MNFLTVVILIFSVLGGIDRILGNRFGLGKEYDKAFMLIGTMALTMIGMIVISPLIADMLVPVSEFCADVLHIDPSIIPTSLFANDMGGAPLGVEMAQDESLGLYNALVVSSMMGCTISFTIPFALGLVSEKNHSGLLAGILCGVATIPIGCFVGGLLCGLPILTLVIDLVPLIIFSGLIAFGLIKFPAISIKIFKVLGAFIKILVTIGLCVGVAGFLRGKPLLSNLAPAEEGVMICFNAAVVLSGAFPFMYIVSKILAKPLNALGAKLGINDKSILGIVSASVTSATTFGMMDEMDKKGVVLNSAFAVSGAFTFGGHLAFTMAFDSRYVLPVIVAKLVSGISALILAGLIYKKLDKNI